MICDGQGATDQRAAPLNQTRIAERNRRPTRRAVAEFKLHAHERRKRAAPRLLLRIPREHTPLPRIMQHTSLLRDPRAESLARQQWRLSCDPPMRKLPRPTARVKRFGRAVGHRKPARRRIHADGILTLRDLRALFRQQKLIDLQLPNSKHSYGTDECRMMH